MAVVLVTGCSSGIGLETALAFARRGDTVVATMRDPGKGDGLRQRADAEGAELSIESLDVTDEGSVSVAVAKVIGVNGTVDVLVNNAGVIGRGPVETISIEIARQVMETNFWGAINTVRAVLPAMRARGSGVIVNVNSIASKLPVLPYGWMYAASKQALASMTESLAGELKPFGVRVVSFEPGFVATDMVANSLSSEEPRSEPYGADQEWIDGFVGSSVGGGTSAADAAAAIVSAVTDPDTPLHLPFGEDAASYLELLSEAGSYEAWMEAVIPALEAAAGPRPRPAAHQSPETS